MRTERISRCSQQAFDPAPDESARDDEVRIHPIARAFGSGGADCIVKPLSPTELTVRVRAVLRLRAEPKSFHLGGLAIHYKQCLETLAGRVGDCGTGGTAQGSAIDYRTTGKTPGLGPDAQARLDPLAESDGGWSNVIAGCPGHRTVRLSVMDRPGLSRVFRRRPAVCDRLSHEHGRLP